MTEIRTIPGWPAYQVTDDGQVIGRHGRPLSPHRVGPYLRVTLSPDGGRAARQHKSMVHRLVAAAFLGPLPDGHQVNHIDGDPSNNTVENLEYVTPSANTRHSIDVLGAVRAPGERNGNARLTTEVVHAIRSAHAAGETAASIGRRLDIDGAHCWRIATRRSWAHVA